MKLYANLVFIAGFILLSATISNAGNIKPSPLDYMTEFCDTIVVGTVEGQESYKENGNIYTDVVIRVEQFIKNAGRETASEITVKYLGGRIGDERLVVQGAPAFTLGEKKMLFLFKPGDKYAVYGLSYGAYRVVFDEIEQEECVRGPYFNYSTYYHPKTKEPTSRIRKFQKEINHLDVFIDEVKGFLR